jgi:hypothetical protein
VSGLSQAAMATVRARLPKIVCLRIVFLSECDELIRPSLKVYCGKFSSNVP